MDVHTYQMEYVEVYERYVKYYKKYDMLRAHHEEGIKAAGNQEEIDRLLIIIKELEEKLKKVRS